MTKYQGERIRIGGSVNDGMEGREREKGYNNVGNDVNRILDSMRTVEENFIKDLIQRTGRREKNRG